MDGGEALLLARAQFGLNIAFHILFPTLTIGLAWLLVYFRMRLASTGDKGWLTAFKVWTKIFALTFAMGVVTGITMSFQFGTNWPGFMNQVGNIAGPLLGYEVLTAFFLEATFLGVMLFGMNRVPPWLHVTATWLVAIGTSLSAFWILALNSWMQTPAGHVVQDGHLIAGSWIGVIFNPSFPYRFTHMMLASFITAAFVVAGLSAWRLLKASTDQAARDALRTGLLVAAILTPVQAFVGDQHGLNTLEHQPAKVAAMEGLWRTQKGIPLVLFAVPNEKEKRNDWSLEIPKLSSLILTHSLDGEVKGYDAFQDVPPMGPVFFAFRGMVGMGIFMILLSWVSFYFLFMKNSRSTALLWLLSASTFCGWFATLCGWLVTEIGRQPWLVQGILRTADAVGTVSPGRIGASLTAYFIVYSLMFVAYMVVLTHLAGKGSQS